jgi:hypothetical protein
MVLVTSFITIYLTRSSRLSHMGHGLVELYLVSFGEVDVDIDVRGEKYSVDEEEEEEEEYERDGLYIEMLIFGMRF